MLVALTDPTVNPDGVRRRLRVDPLAAASTTTAAAAAGGRIGVDARARWSGCRGGRCRRGRCRGGRCRRSRCRRAATTRGRARRRRRAERSRGRSVAGSVDRHDLQRVAPSAGEAGHDRVGHPGRCHLLAVPGDRVAGDAGSLVGRPAPPNGQSGRVTRNQSRSSRLRRRKLVGAPLCVNLRRASRRDTSSGRVLRRCAGVSP